MEHAYNFLRATDNSHSKMLQFNSGNLYEGKKLICTSA